MAKRKWRIGAVVGVVTGTVLTYFHVKEGGDTKDKAGRVVESFIGINPTHDWKWRPQNMTFTVPAVAGTGFSYGMMKMGMNKNGLAPGPVLW